ncbi:Ger(x)C family spore germination protein [Lysinibacillus xylanilyticus]|uniref:Ger(x)C family spore germination protein n=1 Tax=Lysinibacillus xylanilyticus TaxID=582475 RepID=UPI002B248388|nr:Ger(x)C family spore germination protein [Lysinibacillus xylanilyticus]MEB2281325.1 Ger(x)C family spore germination protein [Lysinibacillus xylanilyticus]
MSRIIKGFFILIVTLPILSGCWDEIEPQRMYYVNGVGVDFKDNQYEIYLQLINFKDIAKSETPYVPEAPAEIGYAIGETLEEAIYELYRSIDQEVFWGHMNFLLFTEEALKHEEVISVFDTFLRFRETRYQMNVHLTQDSLKEILLTTPILNKSLIDSKLSHPLNARKLEVFTEPVNLKNLVIGLNEPSHEVSLPLVSIVKNWDTTKEDPSKETTIKGIGILSKDGFKGVIIGDNARGINWMQNKKNRGDLTFKLDNNKSLTVDMEEKYFDVKPVIKGNQVQFDVDIKVDVILNGFKKKATENAIRKGVIKKVKEEIKTTYEAGLKLNVDIYRLSEHLYRNNVKVWKTLENNGKIPLTEESIRIINVEIDKIKSGRKTFSETINK